MTVEIRNPQGQPLTTADRSHAVAESLRQIARASRFADRKKGIRSYQTHIKRDPWIPVLFLLLCVLPTLAGAVYFGLLAADRYVTEARFAIRPAIGGVDKAGGGDEFGAGVPKQLIAQDTLVTSSYIHSRPMVEAMERIMPLREMFSRDSIDWFSRFNSDRPVEKLLKYWENRVKVDVEPNSGIVTLSVNAFDPQESFMLAQEIMKESERKVNSLTTRMRDDALAESERELARAEERLTTVRYALRDLRNRDGILDAAKTNETNLKIIGELRKTRIEMSVQLALMLRDLSPEQRKVQDIKLQIKDIDDNIERIEHQSASLDPERRKVLANSMTQFEAYTAELESALKYYAKVLAAHQKARIIAARQIEFFSPVVQPVLPHSAEQPRRLLMISLTAAGGALLFALSVVARKYVS